MLKTILAAALGLGVLLAAPAQAQQYPTKPITMIVPFAAGGPSDLLARLLAKGMSKDLGQEVLVQNVGGAGGTIGTGMAVKAAPDGYTILLHHIGMSTAKALYPKLTFDPEKDLTPLGLVAEGPWMVVTNKSVPVNNYKELVEYLKKKEPNVTFVNGGVGGGSYLCAMFFTKLVGVKVTNVPYQGMGPGLIDLLAGRGDAACDVSTSFATHSASGDLKAHLVASDERLKTMPDVPTSKEVGLPDFKASLWFGLWGPPNLPAPIVAKLQGALRATMNESIAAEVSTLGMVLPTKEQMTSEALAKRLDDQTALWSPMIKEATKSQ